MPLTELNQKIPVQIGLKHFNFISIFCKYSVSQAKTFFLQNKTNSFLVSLVSNFLTMILEYDTNNKKLKLLVILFIIKLYASINIYKDIR